VGHDSPTVNAYYNPQMNDINFPGRRAAPPLYDPKLDDAPNYGIPAAPSAMSSRTPSTDEGGSSTPPAT